MSSEIIGQYMKYVAACYKSFLFTALIAAGLLVWLLVAYVRSRQPKSGSLDWIREYDKPALVLTDEEQDFSGRDVLYAIISAVGAVFLLIGFLYLRSIFTGRGIAASDGRWMLFKKAFDCFIGGAGMYLLTRSMFGERLPALFAGILFGIASNAVFIGEGFLVWSLFFLWKWLRQDNCAPFWEAAGWMFGAAAMLGLHFLYTMESLWLLPLYLAAFIVKMISRARTAAAGGETTRTALSVSLTIVLAFLAGLALWFAALIRCRDADILELRKRLFSAANYLEILRYIPEMLSRMFRPFKVVNYKNLLLKFPLIAGGCASLVCALIGFIKRNETKAIAVFALGVLVGLEWIFAGTGLLCIAFLPALCYVWSSLCKRKMLLPVCIFGGGILIYHYLNWAIQFSRI